jgi:glycosyltransferase involved in cell wall biosynthesis
MAPILLWLILVLCLVITIVKYLMGIILRFSFPSSRAKKDYTYEPTVSVLMPCFNEGKTVYETIESISKSNYPNHKFEVIAQDDCSVDDSYEWMLKAQRDFTNIRAHGPQRSQQRKGALGLQRAAIVGRGNHYFDRFGLHLPSQRHSGADGLLCRARHRISRRPRRRPKSKRERDYCNSDDHLLLCLRTL